eukprot:TRINITY_DN33651_c0_g1_i1.p1 TRINITY_DN33651_c0_g1~~TRINITY_DN33651_c0_g1_i1.p1  ORF type:complete len:497 (-),score=74.20 TRINITY_DN33651_c0_g1_i1:157-1455(-)
MSVPDNAAGTNMPTTSIINDPLCGLDASSLGCVYGLGGANSVLAAKIVQQAEKLVAMVGKEKEDLLDRDWSGPGGQSPLDFLLGSQSPVEHAYAIRTLSSDLRPVLAAERTLVEVDAPAKVFGDIHGQFRDMLLLLHDFGFPSQTGPTFIFNGDWVDRGRHQLEVVTLVFALKLVFPSKIVLVRGNHEDLAMNKHMGKYGFEARCTHRLGEQPGLATFRAVGDTFNWLPLACLVSHQVLVVHGGIGAGDWSLDRVRSVQRPLTHEALSGDSVLWNMLWSDPIPDEAVDSFGVHDSPRDNHQKLIATFGKDVTSQFCRLNHISMVVRSHQAMKQGCGYDIMHDGKCVRVFSARDYEGAENDGSILDIQPQDASGTLVLKPQVLKSLTKGLNFPTSQRGPFEPTAHSRSNEPPWMQRPVSSFTPAAEQGGCTLQ